MDELTTLTDTVAVVLETVEAAVARVVRRWTRPRDVVARALVALRVTVVRLARPPCAACVPLVTHVRPACAGRLCVQD